MSDYEVGDLVWVPAIISRVDANDTRLDVGVRLCLDSDSVDVTIAWYNSDMQLVPRAMDASQLRTLLEEPQTALVVKQMGALTAAKAAAEVLHQATADFATAKEADIQAGNLLVELMNETP